MTQDKANYLSYLLRLWRDSETENIWRASLECADSGERWGFAGLDDLLCFLRQRAGVAEYAGGKGPSTDSRGNEREETVLD
jgi:hypothetical protein